jgi:hypothetical protein
MLLDGVSSLEIIAQIATAVDQEKVWIVTMYLPESPEWDRGFRIRRVSR